MLCCLMTIVTILIISICELNVQVCIVAIHEHLATVFNTHGAAVTVVMYTNVSVGRSICSTCNIPLQLMHITTTVTISNYYITAGYLPFLIRGWDVDLLAQVSHHNDLCRLQQ